MRLQLKTGISGKKQKGDSAPVLAESPELINDSIRSNLHPGG
jgi:hypothetical protein